MIPAITLAVNLATIIILLLGGRFVIAGSMTLGDFTAFNTYLAILIFPIILLGFMSNVIAQASASYMRLSAVLLAPEAAKDRDASAPLCAATSGDEQRFAHLRRKGSAQERFFSGEGRQHDRDHRTHGGRQDANAVRPDRTA